jgi:hypothetical protein
LNAQEVGALDVNMDPQDFDVEEEAPQGLEAQQTGQTALILSKRALLCVGILAFMAQPINAKSNNS